MLTFRNRRAMLERCRKEVEVAIGLNRQLRDLKPDTATEVQFERCRRVARGIKHIELYRLLVLPGGGNVQRACVNGTMYRHSPFVEGLW